MRVEPGSFLICSENRGKENETQVLVVEKWGRNMRYVDKYMTSTALSNTGVW